MHLFSVENLEDFAFVQKAFPTSDSFHVGVRSFHGDKGTVHADNSFGVGVKLVTHQANGITPVFSQSREDHINLDECLVINKTSSHYNVQKPCRNARGICIAKLGLSQQLL